MSTARVDGLAALQSGDIQTAIARLEAAVQEDPSDFDACLYLGGAYGQAGRPLDAIKSVTQAVQLQPSNAQARYNLGVAMEQGGYKEQALQVYNQAIQLQPDYANAQQAVARLHASSNQGFGAPAGASSSKAVSGQQFGQEQPQPAQQPTQQSTQQYAQPAAFGQQAQQPTAYNPLAPTSEPQPTAYNPLAPPPQSTQTTQQFTPPGLQQPGAFGRPTPPVSQPQQPVEAGLGSYMAPPPPAARPAAPGGYGAPAAYGAMPSAYSSVPAYDDEFKLGQAFKDFFRALFTPKTLLSEMAGCDTSRSAWALFTVYSLVMLVLCVIIGGMMIGKEGPIAPIIGAACGACFIVAFLICWAVFGLIVHMLARAFGSSLRYGASIRCVIYGGAPYIVSTLLMILVYGLAINSGIGAIKDSGIMSPSTAVHSTNSTVGKTPASGKANKSGSSSVKPYTSSGTANSNPNAASGTSGSSPFSTSGPSGSNPYGGPGSTGANPFGNSSSSHDNPFSGPMGVVMAQVYGVMMLASLINLVLMIWSMILLGSAISNIHEISGGSAAGVVILGAIIWMALFFVVYIVFVGAIVAAVMAVAH